MNKFVFILLSICVSNAMAQKTAKIDTVYYLLDTVKTPVADRMWSVDNDIDFKYYILHCPCLTENQDLIFLYNLKNNYEKIIKKKELRKLKLTTITSLINNRQKFIADRSAYAIFIIEPQGRRYIYHKVGLRRAIIMDPSN